MGTSVGHDRHRGEAKHELTDSDEATRVADQGQVVAEP